MRATEEMGYQKVIQGRYSNLRSETIAIQATRKGLKIMRNFKQIMHFIPKAFVH